MIFLMYLLVYFFMVNILHKHLESEAKGALLVVERDVKSRLKETEIFLTSTSNTVSRMLIQDEPQEYITAYILDAAKLTPLDKKDSIPFHGLYGYVRGEFVDSTGLQADGNYAPKDRPWYKAALVGNGNIVYTVPYARYGSDLLRITASKTIGAGLEPDVLAIDVGLPLASDSYDHLRMIPSSYAVLLNQDMLVLSHPREDYLGLDYGELSPERKKITETLAGGYEVSSQVAKDSNSGKKRIVFFKRIYNGWYVGICVDSDSFYHDLNSLMGTIIYLGTTLFIFICIVLFRLNKAKLKADAQSKAKSSFLAEMSHEIRTPMNVIMGMSEFALQTDSLSDAKVYIKDVKQASASLLSLINRILDVSRIEAGALQISRLQYSLASVLRDVVRVIRIRAVEKSLTFTVNVDADAPGNLIGDDVRLKQILVNLLSNAVKYTQEGFVSLRVSVEDEKAGGGKTPPTVVLRFEVKDSGIGIKDEDIPRLFDAFARMDAEKNRYVEGSGLGLPITHNLVKAMDGDVKVESEYGAGSCFTVSIRQTLGEPGKLAEVENAADKRTLFYMDDSFYRESIIQTLGGLGVPTKACEHVEEFFTELEKGVYSFAFIPEYWWTSIENIENVAPGTVIVVLAKTVKSFGENVNVLFAPAYAVTAADALNNRAGLVRSGADGEKWTAPDARVLVIDDNATNLKIAKGFLLPYRVNVDVCVDGETAVGLARERRYDLVFMDNLMPGMNGIQAAAAIRALDCTWESPPIAALSADEVVDARGRLLTTGFDDYLSKPIDACKLEEVLQRWIPRSKQVYVERIKETRGGRGLSVETLTEGIEGINMEKGLFLSGASPERYFKILSIFCKDGEQRLPRIKAPSTDEETAAFVIDVHALKGACSGVGAEAASEQAASLERAGRNKDMETIQKRVGAFSDEFSLLLKRIQVFLDGQAAKREIKPAVEVQDQAIWVGLRELLDALKNYNVSKADDIVEKLKNMSIDAKTRRILDRVEDDLLLSEFMEAASYVEKFLETAT
jgi:signal transduction histidine kinase/CheY-like chemotaxis protein/HPt (histidine-containing phosphotransfer) domain-containing protein